MLEWAEVRPLIARIVGPHLTNLGFHNPGRAMWRFRPVFVDVVGFECRRLGLFQLEFGCGLRRFLPNNPAPWECPFRTQPAHSFGWGGAGWSFCDSEAAQVRVLQELAPRVVAAAQVWFGQFVTVAGAIAALEQNEFSGPRNVALCAPGSVAFRQVMAELRTVASSPEPEASADGGRDPGA